MTQTLKFSYPMLVCCNPEFPFQRDSVVPVLDPDRPSALAGVNATN